MKRKLFALALAFTSLSVRANDTLEWITQLNDCVKLLQKEMGEQTLIEQMVEAGEKEGGSWASALVKLCGEKTKGFPTIEELGKTVVGNDSKNAKRDVQADLEAEVHNPTTMKDAVTMYEAVVDLLIAQVKADKVSKEALGYELISPRLGEELFLRGAKAEQAKLGTEEYHVQMRKIYAIYQRKQIVIADKLGVPEFFALQKAVDAKLEQLKVQK